MGDDLQIGIRRSPLRRLTGVQIVGTGSFLPDNVVTNEALASLGCDAEWIIQRTGIRERRHAPPEMSTSDMAVAAAERCLAAADVPRERDRSVGAGDAFARLSAAGHGADGAGSAGAQLRGDGRLGRVCRVHVRAGDRHAVRRHGCEQVRAGDRLRHEQPRDESGRQENVSALRRRRRRRARSPRAARSRGCWRTRWGPMARATGCWFGPTAARALPTRPTSELSTGWFVKMDGRPVFKWAVRLLEDSSQAGARRGRLSRSTT